jgi:hypothetical protein
MPQGGGQGEQGVRCSHLGQAARRTRAMRAQAACQIPVPRHYGG